LIQQGIKQPDGESFLLNEWLGLPVLSYYELQAVMYLKISVSDFLTVFSARTEGFFFNRAPGKLLLGAACCSLLISTLLAKYWPFGEMEGISWHYVGTVWIYCIVWWLLQDTVKVLAYKVLNSYKEECDAGLQMDDEGAQKRLSKAEVRRNSSMRRASARSDQAEARRRSSQVSGCSQLTGSFASPIKQQPL